MPNKTQIFISEFYLANVVGTCCLTIILETCVSRIKYYFLALKLISPLLSFKHAAGELSIFHTFKTRYAESEFVRKSFISIPLTESSTSVASAGIRYSYKLPYYQKLEALNVNLQQILAHLLQLIRKNCLPRLF